MFNHGGTGRSLASDAIIPRDLITPRRENTHEPPGTMRYQLTPGAYFWSKKNVATLFGLKLVDPPLALVELLAEVNYATPKQVFFFDSRSLLGGDSSLAMHWTDFYQAPNLIPIFLNPRTATPEVVAHELMHSWIEFYLKVEHPWEYVDQSNHRLANAVNLIQSMVLDCTILWVLRKRGGFNLDTFRRDIVPAAVASIEPYSHGMMSASLFGQLVGVEALAVPTAFSDLYELDDAENKRIQEMWDVCRRYEPAMARTADKFTRSLRTYGYDTAEGVAHAIEECLDAAFEFLCVPYERKRDLVPKRMNEDYRLDKMPDFLYGVPPRKKHKVLCDIIKLRRHMTEAHSSPNGLVVQFEPEGSPYSINWLPSITPPYGAQKPLHMDFFPPGTSEKQMDELMAEAKRSGRFPREGRPLPPPNIYGPRFEYSDNFIEPKLEGGSAHVLLP